jgi:hypothetical protein
MLWPSLRFPTEDEGRRRRRGRLGDRVAEQSRQAGMLATSHRPRPFPCGPTKLPPVDCFLYALAILAIPDRGRRTTTTTRTIGRPIAEQRPHAEYSLPPIVSSFDLVRFPVAQRNSRQLIAFFILWPSSRFPTEDEGRPRRRGRLGAHLWRQPP